MAGAAGLLRLRLTRRTAGIDRESDVLIGQVTVIANNSFRREPAAAGYYHYFPFFFFDAFTVIGIAGSPRAGKV